MSETDNDTSPDPERIAVVVEQLTECQGRLFAYIYSLTADPEMARDVLQETNRVLWRKAEQFDTRREFLPWALTHAFNQVRAARSKSSRDRLIFREGETLEALSEESGSEPWRGGERAAALEECLLKLTEKQRALVERYYDRGEPLSEIAASLKRRENTVAVTLHRIRQRLAECIHNNIQTT